ncbi:MAG: DNA polymerase III subunit delta [Bacteroidetes bacterium]|nr:MAG: DNA polymerase III subunit delta [Bacteroidota bacterium]
MLFKEIVGHKELKNRLIRTVLNEKVSHAQLFLGAEGSEKLSLAIAYAQFISCSNKQIYTENSDLLADSCGKCPSCVKYQKLAHPDLHFVFPVATTKSITSKPLSANFIKEWREELIESNYYTTLNEWYKKIGIENKQGRISVDEANQVIKTLGLRAYEGGYKVMIIWMVEKLYHSAAPKLLKILEEPPPKTLFILIAEDTNSILKTILSRTQLVKLAPLRDDDIRDFLKHNFQVSAEKIETIVNIADGSFKNVFPYLSDQVEDNPYFATFREMMLLAYQRNFIKMKQKSEEISKLGRENIKQLLQYGIRIVRMCLYQDLGNIELIKSSGAELDFIQKFSRFVNQNNAEDISEILNEASFHIARNVNPKITLMDTMLKISGIFAK